MSIKIEFIYGQFSSGAKRFNFNNLLDDPNGLSGSEISCFYFAKEMAKRGHQVSLYTQAPNEQQYNWHGVSVLPLSHFGYARIPPDVYYSWNESGMLYFTSSSSLRLMNLQLNDMPYNDPKSFDSVDVFTSVSTSHRDYVKQFAPSHEHKWEIINNCIAPELFDLSIPKEKGKIIYCSSPDRGLHNLLEVYPSIKKECPWVSLHIYYKFDGWYNSLSGVNESSPLIWQEFKRRGDFIKYAFEEMKNGFDIVHHQAVSVNEMHKEICSAEVMCYPVDCPTFTEGFSVSTMQACYGGAVPIISSQDSIGQIYENSGALIVPTPTRHYLDQFVDHTIRVLKDEEYANSIRQKTKAFAADFTFEKEAQKLEKLVIDKLWELKHK